MVVTYKPYSLYFKGGGVTATAVCLCVSNVFRGMLIRRFPTGELAWLAPPISWWPPIGAAFLHLPHSRYQGYGLAQRSTGSSNPGATSKTLPLQLGCRAAAQGSSHSDDQLASLPHLVIGLTELDCVSRAISQ